MTSRERAMAAFNHQESDRVPVWCGASPEFIEKARKQLGLPDAESVFLRFGDDFRRVKAGYKGPDAYSPDRALRPGVASRTPFGVERHGYAYGQPINHPLAGATVERIHAYPWPDPAWVDVSRLRAEASRYQGRYAMLGGDWSPFFHDAIDLMGMEDLLLAMLDEPERVDALLSHLMEYYMGSNLRIFEESADLLDIFFIGNDLGSQTGPLIGEELFRRFLFPHLKNLASLGHEYGLKVMLHCCGGFEPLIPAMIEAGIDALQSLQPSAAGMDPAALKSRYGKQMVFNGCIDSHHVLIDGTPDLVRDTTRKIISIMKPGGGFVVSASHDFILEETPVENVLAMFDTASDQNPVTCPGSGSNPCSRPACPM